jgi:hypothetical protein
MNSDFFIVPPFETELGALRVYTTNWRRVCMRVPASGVAF